MNIPPKYEDVVAELEAATKELESYKSMDHNQLLAQAAGEHLKSTGAENYTGVVFTIELDDGSHRYEVVVSTQKVDAVTVFEKLAALQRRLTVAEQRAEMLEREFKKLRDVAHGCYEIASSYSGSIDGVEEHGGDDHEDPSCAIHHRLYYAMLDADAALKPAEEVDHGKA